MLSDSLIRDILEINENRREVIDLLEVYLAHHIETTPRTRTASVVYTLREVQNHLNAYLENRGLK